MKGGFNLYNRGFDGKLKRRLPHGEFKSDYSKPGDVQQFSRGDKASNANDAIEFGPWQDGNDWKPVLENGTQKKIVVSSHQHLHGSHPEKLAEAVLHAPISPEHDSYDEDDVTKEEQVNDNNEASVLYKF